LPAFRKNAGKGRYSTLNSATSWQFSSKMVQNAKLGGILKNWRQNDKSTTLLLQQHFGPMQWAKA
jgi:hypothetical protein